jgi:hypothetical protein
MSNKNINITVKDGSIHNYDENSIKSDNTDETNITIIDKNNINKLNNIASKNNDKINDKIYDDIKSNTEETKTETDILDILPQATFEYRQVDEMLKEAFNYKESNNSMICDIIAMYIKGQKILYTEAKTLCEQRLSYLMLPTISITAICAVISVVLKDYEFGSTIVSCLSGLNFFFLTLINYLKLDAKAEAHRVSAYKFDKTQSRLEFSSGKILFISGESKELPKIINETEKDVREIKETNQFILPESIRYTYPRLTSMNIFAEVKKIQSDETQLINSLKDILNEHVNLNLKVRSQPPDTVSKEDLKKLAELEQKKKEITNDIIQIRDKYLEIDNKFEEEMRVQRLKINGRLQLCGCLKT